MTEVSCLAIGAESQELRCSISKSREDRMKSKFTIQLALAVVLTFEFSNATYAAPPADACSLLTADQVSKVLAVSVKNGERVVANSPKMYGWAGPGGPSNSKRVVASIITLDTFEP